MLQVQHANFFIFGAGNRKKLLYKQGSLTNALTGESIFNVDVKTESINDDAYSVTVNTLTGACISIMEDEAGIHLDTNGNRELLSASPVILPDFAGHPYQRLLRILHHEILINIVNGEPLPNFMVYKKPWYRDAAMMAMVLQKTGNESLLFNWIKNLRSPYDRNNHGNEESDNLGQVLYLISCLDDAAGHALIPVIMQEVKRWTIDNHLFGTTDYHKHPVYQTLWLKYGLQQLGFNDTYRVPDIQDSYAPLFWWNKAENTFNRERSFADCRDYPYLTWAEAHFFADPPPLHFSGTRFPLTWEANASDADYSGIAIVDSALTKNKICMPHTWHAAEMFLYLIEQTATIG